MQGVRCRDATWPATPGRRKVAITQCRRAGASTGPADSASA
jgi:hypothetical protein